MKSLSILSVILIILLSGCKVTKEEQFSKFVDSHVKEVKPLKKQLHLDDWQAAVTGNPEDYDKASKIRFQLRQIYSNPKDFTMLSELKSSNQIADKQLARQLDALYYGYLQNQIEPVLMKKIVDLGTKIEKNFSTFRSTIGQEEVTANEIKEILKTETDLAKRKEAYLSSKQVGPVVAADLIRLVKLRNHAARKIGFDNYHTLSLTCAEQDVKDLDRIFGELYELTNEPFAELKRDLDGILASKYNIDNADLRPWHYHDPFFQETPLVYEPDLDTYYQDKDVKELGVKFFAGLGLPVKSIIAASDLYDRKGKNPHAFCTDIDREGDVRILCNLKNNEQWMETLLHELGHAVYDKYHDPDVPYLLREPAHIFTTEATAMFFGRLSRNGSWMQEMLELSDRQRSEIEKVSGKYAKLKQLIFVRWAMVMYDFEKQLYTNPDQDLNSLWWQMVEKYQLVKGPQGREEPDWAAKIHFSVAPCYYHNYVLGELLASQIHHHLVFNVLKLESDKDVSYIGTGEAGEFFQKKIFEQGSVYHWDKMIEQATGEPLKPEYFINQFVK